MLELNRRGFLKAGAVVGGVLALPSSLRGAAVTGAERPVRLGFIGMGKMCMGHVSGLRWSDRVDIKAVCDCETIRLKKSCDIIQKTYDERFGKGARKIDMYVDFRELLRRPDIDAVLIATQTHWHAAMSILAMQAGKHVYCEKPMSLSIQQGQAIMAAAKRYNCVFQNGSQQRSDGKFRLACELVRNGCIGKVKTIFVNNVGGPSGPCYLPTEPTPPTIDWDLWLGPAPLRGYNKILCPFDDWKVFPAWRSYEDYDGGGMTDWGAHHFDIAQWALGMDQSGPVAIIPPRESEFRRLTYVYANGTKMVHGGAKPSEAGVEFVGEKGRVCVNRGYLWTDPEELMRTKWGAGDIRLYESSSHFGNFLDCIRDHRECICNPEVGHRSTSVCHLGIICYRLDRTLRWDPERERFQGDAAADRLLYKPARAPWVV